MRQKIASIAQWLQIPSVCVLCHHYHQGNFAVCHACSALLVQIREGCNTCRLPLVNGQCGYCIKNKPAFDTVFSTYYYEEPLRTLLHEFKYNKAIYLRTFMVKLMLDALNESLYKPCCLVPVPMHRTRIQQRGFNHAAELAKLLGKELAIPVKLSLCKKILNTAPQVSLDSKNRRLNLKHAFIAKPNDYKHVTIIDDLLTTGSTANELAITLKKQGVARVDVWCLARTPASD